jgi:hypothetical protein
MAVDLETECATPPALLTKAYGPFMQTTILRVLRFSRGVKRMIIHPELGEKIPTENSEELKPAACVGSIPGRRALFWAP